MVTTVAGSTQGYADGTGPAAQFYSPHGVAVDTAGNLYVADTDNHRIRQIVIATGVVTTLAGSGAAAFVDGTGTTAQFNYPIDVAVDTAGNLYVADTGNQRIRKIVVATGVVTTLAGDGTYGYADGTGTAAQFRSPYGVAVDTAGNLYVADTGNQRIRKIVVATGAVTTVAGSTQGYADGTGTAAQFRSPYGVAVDTAGNLYVADSANSRICKIVVATGVVTTLAGSTQGYADGTGTAARFDWPQGVAVDTAGNLYVADTYSPRIRKIVVATGVVTTLAGGTYGYADGTGPAAQFSLLVSVAADTVGNLYVADAFNYRIRQLSPPYADFSSTPASGSTLNVGTATVGSPVSTTLSISEIGTAQLNVTSLALSGTDAAEFSISPSAAFSIADGGAAQTVTLTCTPTTAAAKTATLTVTHNGAGTVGSPATYTLNCTGILEEDTTGESTYVPPPPPPETKVIVAFGGNGKGKVTSTPTGIDCQSPYACNYTFKTNTAVQLNPQAVGNSRFQNWGDSCNNGTISASGGTVYCTVYFVDTTPPPIEPTPVDVPVDNQPPTDTPVDNPTPIDIPIDNQTSTDTSVDNSTSTDISVDNQTSTDTSVDNPTSTDIPVDNQTHTDTSVDVPTDSQIPPPVDNPEEPPMVEEPIDAMPEPETVIPPAKVLPPAVSDETCPPKDTLSHYCNARGKNIQNLDLLKDGVLSDAVITGTVTNKGWLSNLTVTESGSVTGGVITGLNTNEGYMGDFIFKGEFIKGGTLGGKILNLSKIFSWFEDVTLSANAHLIGGALKGKIKGDPKNPALLENLRILAGSEVSGVIIGNGVKIDKDVKIEESTVSDTPADDAELPALDEQFSAGIGVNGSSYQTRNVAQKLSDNASIRGKIHVEQKYVGQKVKIFVTVAYRFSEDSTEEFFFTVNELNGLMPWNGKKSSLGKNPFKMEETLQTTHSVKIYDGILLATGVVNIQFGYLLEDGTIVQTPESIELLTRE